MDVSSAMQWWEEWQLRVLVLCSLFIQFFLIFGAFVRTKPKMRAFIWLAYIGGDAVAIYALATLFSRQKKLAVDGRSGALEVIWAPILLIHLGGQNSITAFSLEDNELWRRHVLTLVTQVTVALYVFCKWWSGGERLLAAAVLLFIVGIIKFAQKPWMLRKASFDSLQAASSLSPPRKGGIIAELWTFCTGKYMEIESAGNNGWRERQELQTLQRFVEQASSFALEQEVEDQAGQKVLDHMESAMDQTNYFVDVIAPYSARLRELKSFMDFASSRGNLTIDWYIATKFNVMYTNFRAVSSPLSIVLQILFLPSLTLASLVLFATSHKDGYSADDIRVTYIILYCAAVQEFNPWLSALAFLFLQNLPKCMGTIIKGGEVMVPQYNLLSYCARKRKPTILMKFATFNILRELVSKYGCISELDSANKMTAVVFLYVKYGWKDYIRGDVARYRRFNNFRGQWILSTHGLMERLGWSISSRFDESVLLWHIATELCFSHPNTSPEGVNTAQMSKDISNYMMYLLFIRPEMLIPGTRPALFSIASEDIELLLKDSRLPLDKEENIAREILKATKTENTLIHDACKLAEALMELDEEKRWVVIGGAWMEMLCYSVSRCRGYLLAKTFGQGVSFFLSRVWVTWSFMGMETWVERYHRLEYPEGGGAAEEGEAEHWCTSFYRSHGEADEGVAEVGQGRGGGRREGDVGGGVDASGSGSQEGGDGSIEITIA